MKSSASSISLYLVVACLLVPASVAVISSQECRLTDLPFEVSFLESKFQDGKTTFYYLVLVGEGQDYLRDIYLEFDTTCAFSLTNRMLDSAPEGVEASVALHEVSDDVSLQGVRWKNANQAPGTVKVYSITFEGLVYEAQVNFAVFGGQNDAGFPCYAFGMITGPSSCDGSLGNITVPCDEVGRIPEGKYKRMNLTCPNEYCLIRKCPFPKARTYDVSAAHYDEECQGRDGPDTAIFLPSISSSSFTWGDDVYFVETTSQTAHLVGTVDNGNHIRLKVDLQLAGKSDTPTAPIDVSNECTSIKDEWRYYAEITGTITGLEHGNSLAGMKLHVSGAADAQLGLGASIQTNKFIGMAINFDYTVAVQPSMVEIPASGSGSIRAKLVDLGLCEADAIITVVDTVSPVFIDFPENIMMNDCSAILSQPEPPRVMADDNCGETKKANVCRNVYTPGYSGIFFIVDTYTATDECGNSRCRTRTITCYNAPTVGGAGKATIQGTVFVDVNGDRLHNEGEPTLQQAGVLLYQSNNQDMATAGFSVTSGLYELEVESSGEYILRSGSIAWMAGQMEEPVLTSVLEEALRQYPAGMTEGLDIPYVFNVGEMQKIKGTNRTCGTSLKDWKDKIYKAWMETVTFTADHTDLVGNLDKIAERSNGAFQFVGGHAEKLRSALLIMSEPSSNQDAWRELGRTLLAAWLNEVHEEGLVNRQLQDVALQWASHMLKTFSIYSDTELFNAAEIMQIINSQDGCSANDQESEGVWVN